MKDILLEYFSDHEFVKYYESTLNMQELRDKNCNCPGKHGLKGFIINSWGWGCDKCGGRN